MQGANRRISIEKDSEAAMAFVRQWVKDNPLATNVEVDIEKHCEGKQVTIDYDE